MRPTPRTRARKLAVASGQIEQYRLAFGERSAAGLGDSPALRSQRSEALGYTLLLLNCALPHTEPTSNSYSRAHGRYALHITAHPDLGLPYGPIPRLLNTHIITEVRRTGSPRIQLGSNLARVADRLELSGDGPTYRRYKDMLRRSLSATYQFRIAPGPDEPATQFRNLSIAADGTIDWDSDDWHGTINVSSDLLAEITRHSFPVWLSFLRQLMRSPLGMDLYVWCAHQTYAAWQRGRAFEASYQELAFLLGSDYAETKAFGRAIRRELGLFLPHIPEWRVDLVHGGLRVHPSPPHVPPTRLFPSRP